VDADLQWVSQGPTSMFRLSREGPAIRGPRPQKTKRGLPCCVHHGHHIRYFEAVVPTRPRCLEYASTTTCTEYGKLLSPQTPYDTSRTPLRRKPTRSSEGYLHAILLVVAKSSKVHRPCMILVSIPLHLMELVWLCVILWLCSSSLRIVSFDTLSRHEVRQIQWKLGLAT